MILFQIRSDGGNTDDLASVHSTMHKRVRKTLKMFVNLLCFFNIRKKTYKNCQDEIPIIYWICR